MGIATALGNTFIMPQAQPQQRGQQAGSGQQDGGQSMLGQLPTGMQNIEGITDELYNSWGKLEQFAQDMKIRFGIDVTRPDFSSEEAMQAHKTFQKAHAALLYKANRLTQAQKDMDKYNSQIMGTQGNRYGYQGDPSQEIFDPNKVTVAEAEKSYSGLSPEEYDRRQAIEQRNELERIRARNAGKKGAVGGSSSEIAPTLESLSTELSSIFSGDADWKADPNTGEIRSELWKGRYIGKKDATGKIQGIVLGEDGNMYIESGKGEKVITEDKEGNRDYEKNPDGTLKMAYERTLLDNDTAKKIIIDIVEAEGLSRTEADKWFKELKKQGKTPLDFFKEGTGEALSQAKLQAEQVKIQQQAKQQQQANLQSEIEELVSLADSTGTADGAKKLTEKLKGKKIPTGELQGKEIDYIEQRSVLKGKYLIHTTDGETVSIGGSGGTLSADIIKDMLIGGDTNNENDPLGLGI
jgi:hypothetical protein